MEENNSKIIRYHQRKRKKHKIKLLIRTIFFILIALFLIVTYLKLTRKHFIEFKETSNLKYQVNLLENEFYETDYLDKDVNVIASLIKNIDVEFKYNFELSEDFEYEYNYRILAETEVKEKTKTNLIYDTKKELLNKADLVGNNNKLEIVENLTIDYNDYNNQIDKLLEIYELKNTSSELLINFYINITNKSTGEQINIEEKVMSLQIPLISKTVELSMDKKNCNGQFLVSEGTFENPEYILGIGIFVSLLGLINLIKLIKYILDTRSAEKMYDDRLKKILFDYKSYIQKINNKLDYNDYKVIQIDTFNELLSMREEVQSPIFMYKEENIRRTEFIMINENLLFEFILDSDLIRADLIKRSKEKENKKNEKNK